MYTNSRIKPIIPQVKATDKPYCDVAVLYIVKDSLTSLIEGSITGNIDANDDVIPPSINRVDNIKP
tara:strand:- start:127 stop:324 length:198 start_codon:yes stop_codon:yes gene_type:complete